MHESKLNRLKTRSSISKSIPITKSKGKVFSRLTLWFDDRPAQHKTTE